MAADKALTVTITFPTGQNIKFLYNTVTYSDAKTVLTETLQAKEALQIQNTDSAGDFSGTFVKCSLPCAVFAGSKSTVIGSGEYLSISQVLRRISWISLLMPYYSQLMSQTTCE